MTLTEIKAAITAGKKVCYENSSYSVIKDNKDQYLISHANGHCIGLTWQDGVTLNGNEQIFFIHS